MDKQKLPLQVLRFLKELEKKLESSGIDLETVSNSTYFLLIRSKKYPDFFFNLGWSKQNNNVIFSAEFYPASPTGQVSKFDFEGSIVPHVENWLSYLKEYDSIDISSLFPIKNPLQPKEDIFEEKDKILPYSLKNLSVVNFQGIKQATIENLPVDTQWVFLVGENGFGKSTVLQSILLGLYGSKDGKEILIEDQNIQIQVEYKSEKDNFINDCWKNSHPLLHIAAYGPFRLNLQVDATISEEARKSSVTYGLFKTDGVLLNIEAKMKDWLLQEDTERFELAKKSFCQLIPYLSIGKE